MYDGLKAGQCGVWEAWEKGIGTIQIHEYEGLNAVLKSLYGRSGSLSLIERLGTRLFWFYWRCVP